MVKQELKEKLLQYTYRFYDRGLTPAEDSGDISLRDPETNLIYIDPRPSKTLRIYNWRSITVDDIVVVDLDGRIVEASDDRYPTVELPMHLAIYRARPEVYGIVHSHAVYSSAFAISGWDIPTVLAEQALYVGGDAVCAENGAVGSRKLADHIVEALGKERKAALLRSHGAVCIGKDIEEAFSVSEYLERDAQAVFLAYAMGAKPIPLDLDDLVDPCVEGI